MTSVVVIAIGALVFIAHALEDLFSRTKVTDVLFLMIIGLALGPVLGLVSTEDMGRVGPVFTTLTLIVILFEGGLKLDLKVLGKSFVGATGLTLLSFIGTLAAIAPTAKLLLGLDWLQALTLASALGGTSSAMVIPVVRRLALGDKTKTVLMLESALSDVLMIVVALALIGLQLGGRFSAGHILGGIAKTFIAAAIIGIVAGIIWSAALNWFHGLKKSIFTTPAYVMVVYGVVELMGFSGAIAALLIGVTLGNIHILSLSIMKKHDLLARPSNTERAVFEEVSFLLKTFFFVYVGIAIQLNDIVILLIGFVLTALLFAIRVLVVRMSLFPRSSFSRFDASISGAMNPKGLAAAVVASMPLQFGIAKGEVIQSAAFSVILFSIITASILVFLIERGWFYTSGRMLYSCFSETASPETAPDPETGSPGPQTTYAQLPGESSELPAANISSVSSEWDESTPKE